MKVGRLEPKAEERASPPPVGLGSRRAADAGCHNRLAHLADRPLRYMARYEATIRTGSKEPSPG